MMWNLIFKFENYELNYAETWEYQYQSLLKQTMMWKKYWNTMMWNCWYDVKPNIEIWELLYNWNYAETWDYQ
jgi:hypothetical protein